METMFNLGLTDRRTHNKLIIRIWAADAAAAAAVFEDAGLLREYDLRYVRPDTWFTAHD